MNKKRLAVFVLILIIIVAIVCTIVLNINKENDNEGSKEKTKTYTEEQWKEFATEYYEKSNSKVPSNVKIITDGVDFVVAEIYDDTSSTEYIERYTIDYKTGIGYNITGEVVEFKLK